MRYVYKGNQKDAAEPIEPAPAPEPMPAPKEPQRRGRKPVYGTGCGTPAGAATHRREGTPTCDPCRKARALYRRNLRQAQGQTVRIMLPVDAQCPSCGHHLKSEAA